MFEFPFHYERIAASTWAYMSSLMMIALFFKFNRFWSFRNFDLLLIILLAPGLLMVEAGRRPQADQDLAQVVQELNGHSDPSIKTAIAEAEPESATEESRSTNQQLQRWGYCWLFAMGGILLLRLLVDPSLRRKPLLDPNLTSGGLIFLGLSLMVFLYANVIVSEPTADDLRGAQDALKLIQRRAADETDAEQLKKQGPGYWLFNLIPIVSTSTFDDGDELLDAEPEDIGQLSRYVVAAKSLAISSQVLIVLGLILFCHYNYKNFNVGVGIATIYLMLPYTAIYTGYALHSLPAALIMWAVVSFRRPLLAGCLLGLATGVSYYPIFLLPLWISFYWTRGARLFVCGMTLSLAVCIMGLVFTSPDSAFFLDRLRSMFGFLIPRMQGLEGIWALGWNYWYRLPLLVAFVVLAVSFVSWPTEKNLGTLISCSASLMVAVQFWMGFDGGLCMAWYLPLALLVFFRPNLDGRVAEAELAG